MTLSISTKFTNDKKIDDLPSIKKDNTNSEIPKNGYMMKLTEEQIGCSLSVISDFGGNIFKYFLRNDIKELYIYGGENLAGRLAGMAEAVEDFRIDGFLGPDKAKITIYRPYLLSFEIRSIEDIVDTDVPILVVCSIGPDARRKLEHHFSKLFFIDAVCAHEYYVTCCVEPLLGITRATGAGLLLVNRAVIGKNPSEYEKWLLGNINKISIDKRSENYEVYKNAFAPYGYDNEYMRACFTTVKREKRFFKGKGDNTASDVVMAAADCDDPLVNCADGMRYTAGLWPEAAGNIYFLGHTVAFGIGVDDGATIESHLQALIKEKQANDYHKYNVLNYANSYMGDVFEIPRLLRRLPLRQGDIVICLLSYPRSVLREFKYSAHISEIDDYFERPHDMGEIFIDTLHMNSNGYRRYAEAIFDSLIVEGLIKKPLKAGAGFRPFRKAAGTGFVVNAASVMAQDEQSEQDEQDELGDLGEIGELVDPGDIGEKNEQSEQGELGEKGELRESGDMPGKNAQDGQDKFVSPEEHDGPEERDGIVEHDNPDEKNSPDEHDRQDELHDQNKQRDRGDIGRDDSEIISDNAFLGAGADSGYAGSSGVSTRAKTTQRSDQTDASLDIKQTESSFRVSQTEPTPIINVIRSFSDEKNRESTPAFTLASPVPNAVSSETASAAPVGDGPVFTLIEPAQAPPRDVYPSIDFDPEAASDPDLFSYLIGLSRYGHGGITQAGAVIINANPFTHGHRHLIESTASLMQHVYVFVVEDEKSVFPYEDRLQLAREGTDYLTNVTVIPGGRYIISQKSIESRLHSRNARNLTASMEADLEMFARYIATALNITAYYTGDIPPDDYVARQFDTALRTVLPRFGVEFKSIPQREYGGAPISASRVRALLREQKFSEIERLVPPATLAYLREMYRK